MKISDVHTDQGHYLRSCFPSRRDLPPYVQQLYPPDPGALNEDFAYVTKLAGGVARFWPLVDPANTWCSALYFSKFFPGLPKEAAAPAAGRVLSACRAFEVTPPLQVLEVARGKLPSGVSEKAAEVRLLPGQLLCGNRLETLESAQAYLDRWDRIEPADRRKIAVALQRLSGLQVFRVPEKMARYLGDGVDLSRARGAIQIRMRHLDPLVATGAQRAYSAAIEGGGGDLEKTAQAVGELDGDLGLARYWNQGIPDPYLSVVGVSKQAEYSWHKGSEHVTAADLLGLRGRSGAGKSIQRVFGPDLGARILKDPVGAFQALPEGQKVVLARLARYARGEAGY